MKSLRILGTRGIPAQHGGFETFAEQLALYLSKRGWHITVYCQADKKGPIIEDQWQGIRRVHIPISIQGAKGTVLFDWISTVHASKSNDTILTLGYNTALFCLFYRVKGRYNFINMDGIEWKRAKWSLLARAWLYLNERLACRLGNHLIADNPRIKDHLASRVDAGKISTIAYGAPYIEQADESLLAEYRLQARRYVIVIARPEPENSILEIVAAFSQRPRGVNLVVLGDFEIIEPQYADQVKAAASQEVIFPGAIYAKEKVQALRYFAQLYAHGHQVGGTNPSLVEAMGAGSAILAHDNPFNRWVAGEGAAFFTDQTECANQFDVLLDNQSRIRAMQDKILTRFHKEFTWKKILHDYEQLLGSNSSLSR